MPLTSPEQFCRAASNQSSCRVSARPGGYWAGRGPVGALMFGIFEKLDSTGCGLGGHALVVMFVELEWAEGPAPGLKIQDLVKHYSVNILAQSLKAGRGSPQARIAVSRSNQTLA